jgi:hypothetical protein
MIINPNILDATAGGIESINCQWGYGLDVSAGRISSPTGYAFALGGGGIASGDPEARGLQGVNITGVHCDGVVAMFDFYGTKADKTNVRGIVVMGNSIINGQVVDSGFTEVENGEFGPNNVYGALNLIGASKTYLGWPMYADRTAAAGLTIGQMFITSVAPHTLQVV